MTWPSNEQNLILCAKDENKQPCEGRLFVSASAMERFKSLLSSITNPSSSSSWKTFAVSNDFQYGQKDAKGGARFLVFHDKGNKLYQAGDLLLVAGIS